MFAKIESKDEFYALVGAQAKKASIDKNVDVLLECAFALYPHESPEGAKEPHSVILLDKASKIILARKSKEEAERFLESAGLLQVFMDPESQEQVLSLACGRPINELIKNEAVASLSPIVKTGKDLFDPEIRTRGSDKEIAAKLGKGIVLALRARRSQVHS